MIRSAASGHLPLFVPFVLFVESGCGGLGADAAANRKRRLAQVRACVRTASELFNVLLPHIRPRLLLLVFVVVHCWAACSYSMRMFDNVVEAPRLTTSYARNTE